jgi:SH3-like domain-containing protein
MSVGIDMGGRRLGSLLLSAACILLAAAGAYSLFADPTDGEVRAAAAAETSQNPEARGLGPSGLPVPRFVSLKTDIVNVRRGPSSEHEVAWVFRRKGLPVEIIAEFEHWRRIRDSDGEEGWIYQSLLAGNRTAIVEPWKKDAAAPLRSKPERSAAVVAMLKSGVIGRVEQCTGQWCELHVDGYDGWIDQTTLFGVYPGERLGD